MVMPNSNINIDIHLQNMLTEKQPIAATTGFSKKAQLVLYAS